MPKVKFGNYNLMPQDADLQEDEVEKSPFHDGPSFGFVSRLVGAAKRRAVEMINSAIGAKIAGGRLTLGDFKATKEAMDNATGKYIAVEWKLERAGTGQGERAGTWTILLDIDDVPEGVASNGPDRPHVGYSYWYKAANSAFNVSRVNGHVFINVVPASRNTLTERPVD
jgi:hypothetical protein